MSEIRSCLAYGMLAFLLAILIVVLTHGCQARAASPCCSAACTCGCQAGQPCPCNGPVLPRPRKIERAEDQPMREWATEGVDRAKIAREGGRYIYRGKSITREKAMELAEKGLPDDAGKPRLTLIGSVEDCKRVLDDLANNPGLKAEANRWVIQAYRPTDWAIKSYGFKADGKPTIYCQLPSGQVRHRQDNYDGPEKLVGALRRAHPDYDPAKDPDATRTPAPKSGGGGLASLTDWLSQVPQWVWLVGAVGLGLWMFSRKNGGTS